MTAAQRSFCRHIRNQIDAAFVTARVDFVSVHLIDFRFVGYTHRRRGNLMIFAAERMEDLAGKASLRDAGTTAGIATDKLLALLGENAGVPCK